MSKFMVDNWGLTCMVSPVMNTMHLLLTIGRVLVGLDGMRLEVGVGSSFTQLMVI